MENCIFISLQDYLSVSVSSEGCCYTCSEEDTLDEAEMPEADYEQKKRLLDLAKAHTAQLMSKMDELPLEERQSFLQSQVGAHIQCQPPIWYLI